jgi:carboxyl-terminal processing protease
MTRMTEPPSPHGSTPTTPAAGEHLGAPAGQPAEPAGQPAEPGGASPQAGGVPSRAAVLLFVAGSITVLLLAAVSFLAGVGVERLGLLSPAPEPTPPASLTTGERLELIEEAWTLLFDNYVDSTALDATAMSYAAISALADAVGDTAHTMFLTPDDLAASRESLSGTYAGIGTEMNLVDDEPVIVGVFRDTPAERAGLLVDDVIAEIDGEPTKGVALDVIVSRIRGPEGTAVTLGIRRTGSAGLLSVRIVRATVSIPVVTAGVVPGTTIRVVRLEQFSDGVADALRVELRSAVESGATGLVLDLRGNEGGYVVEATRVASEFLRDGVVYIERDAKRREAPVPVVEGGIALDLPVVVLVDGATASAAEIVTGALQDAGRSVTIGTRTFGTGTVLSLFELSDGSALRIGTVEWLTPDGRVIWRNGLEPDVTVELPEDARPILPEDLEGASEADVRSSGDAQLLAALERLLGRPY